jgi:hypothetical protein
MVTWNGPDELGGAALSKEIVWHRFKERERKVRRDFWGKLKRSAGQVPFVEDLVAAYYCALIRRPLCGCAVSYSQHLLTSSLDGIPDP